MADNPQTDLEYIRDLLSPYIDGEVTAEERRQVESALADSAELQQELESLQQTVLLLKHLPTMPAPRPFTLSEADVQPIRPAKKRPFWLSGWFGGLAAATAAVICVTVVFFNQSMSMGGALQQADVAMAPAVQNAEAPAESGAVPPGEAETAAEAAPAAEELMQSAAVEEESAEDTVTAADSTAVERYAAEAAESAAAPAEGAAREAEPAPPAPSPSSTGTFAAEADAAAAQPVEPETRVEAEAEAPVPSPSPAAPAPADQAAAQMSEQAAVTAAEEASPAEPAPAPSPAAEVAEEAAEAPAADVTTAESATAQEESQSLALEMTAEASQGPTDQFQAAKVAPETSTPASLPPAATAISTATPLPTPSEAVALTGPEPTAAASPAPASPATETAAPGTLPWLIGGLAGLLVIAGLVYLFARQKR